jgi:prepilin-type N-terminal cleavage/methylation domain-containing protein
MRTRQRGFTIIELMTAMALLAVLAVIAWTRFNRAHEKALRAVLLSDIRNLATAEELYFRLNQQYTTDLSLLSIDPSPQSSMTVTAADVVGWAAYNEIDGTDEQCEMYVGKSHSSPLGLADASEKIACGVP